MTEITLSTVIDKALAEPDFRMNLLANWEKAINESGLALAKGEREKLQKLVNQTHANIEAIFSRAKSTGKGNGNCWLPE